MSASDLNEAFIFDSNGMSDRCVFDGNQTFTLKTVDGWKCWVCLW